MKIRLWSLFTVLIATPAFAADNSVGGFGVQIGENFSNYDFSGNGAYADSTNKTGGLVGIHLEGFNFSSMFGMRIEANYSVIGYTAGGVTVNQNYLQIPLLLKFRPMVGPFGVFAEAGPAASLHLGSSTSVGSTTVTENSASGWDFSLLAGVGVSLKVAAMVFELEGRYDGLKNVSSDPSVETKSRAIQAIAGVTFLFR